MSPIDLWARPDADDVATRRPRFRKPCAKPAAYSIRDRHRNDSRHDVAQRIAARGDGAQWVRARLTTHGGRCKGTRDAPGYAARPSGCRRTARIRYTKSTRNITAAATPSAPCRLDVKDKSDAVSYTHLTLPTKRIV